ncbi:MAG: hypothetical protein WC557_00635 [Ignavibacteriaceae bacterium]
MGRIFLGLNNLTAWMDGWMDEWMNAFHSIIQPCNHSCGDFKLFDSGL